MPFRLYPVSKGRNQEGDGEYHVRRLYIDSVENHEQNVKFHTLESQPQRLV